MSLIIRLLLILTIFTASMEYWSYSFGFRLYIFEIFASLFIFFFFVRFLLVREIILPTHNLKVLSFFLLILFSLTILSFFLIDVSMEMAVEQYFKILMYKSVYILFFLSLIIFVNNLGYKYAEGLLKVFVISAIGAGMFSFAEVTLALSGFDLPGLVFGFLGTSHDGKLVVEFQDFFRAGGWAGINLHAALMLSTIPVLIVGKPFKKDYLNHIGLTICIFSLLITMSRSAIILLPLIFIIIFLNDRRYITKFRLPGFLIFIVAISLLFIFPDNIIEYVVERKFSLDSIFYGRSEVYLPILEAISERPMGYGAGQYYISVTYGEVVDFSVLKASGYGDTEIRAVYANTHSDWMNWMFEYGLFGFFIYLLFYAWLFFNSLVMKSKYAIITACNIATLSVSSLFHTFLDHFFIIFIIILSSLLMFLGEDRDIKEEVRISD